MDERARLYQAAMLAANNDPAYPATVVEPTGTVPMPYVGKVGTVDGVEVDGYVLPTYVQGLTTIPDTLSWWAGAPTTDTVEVDSGYRGGIYNRIAYSYGGFGTAWVPAEYDDDPYVRKESDPEPEILQVKRTRVIKVAG